MLPRATRVYLAAMADSLLPALVDGARVTIFSLEALEGRHFQRIEHPRVAYRMGRHSARGRRGERELQQLVEALHPEVYWSADPLIRPPNWAHGHRPRVVFAVEELRHFLRPQDFSWWERLRWRWVARARLLAADVVVCPTHALQVGLIAQLGLALRRRTQVVMNGIRPIFRQHSPEEVLEVRRRWLVPQRYVLMVENEGAQEALAVPLQALARSEEVSSLTCVIVGREALADALRETVRTCHLEGMVRFLPIEYLAAADLSALYSGAMVVFEPTRGVDFRPTIGQSLACGTPVICAAGETNEELFGAAVMRVHPTDPAEWSKAFMALMLSGALREKFRARGAACVAERTWTGSVKAAFAVGRRLVEGTP